LVPGEKFGRKDVRPEVFAFAERDLLMSAVIEGKVADALT